jgi:hypothetical protein
MKISGPKTTPAHLKPPARGAEGPAAVIFKPRFLFRSSFPNQDINLIIKQGAEHSPSLSPLQFKLDLADDLPPVAGTIIEETPLPRHNTDQSWAANLRLIIFDHLLNNSWQAGATEIAIRTRLEGEFVTLEIRDNGRGIRREDDHDIALYACGTEAARMCGSFELVASQGIGATFRLTLPVGTNRSLVAGLFSSLYYLTPYGEKLCHDNVVELAGKFESKGFDLHDAKILFLTTNDTGLFAAKTRGGNPRHWTSWHAVLEHEGLILDLNYPRPEAVPVGDYFTKMFATHPSFRTRLETVLVRAIPIRTYLDGLRQGKDHLWHLYCNRTYLPQALTKYLLNAAKT